MSAAADSMEGACHCGAVHFTLRLRQGLAGAARCNCSICRMRGAVVLFVPTADLAVTQGADRLSEYRFNTREARHYFCAVCGIYTHHQRRADPNQYCVNVACLAGVSPFDFAALPVVDGIHHPNDSPEGRGSPMKRVGTLRYEPSVPENAP
jgi:hypothetical protein